jgi:hypothetical protein
MQVTPHDPRSDWRFQGRSIEPILPGRGDETCQEGFCFGAPVALLVRTSCAAGVGTEIEHFQARGIDTI